MIELEGELSMTETFEIISTKTKPVDSASKTFQKMSMALIYLTTWLSLKECDKLMQSIF